MANDKNSMSNITMTAGWGTSSTLPLLYWLAGNEAKAKAEAEAKRKGRRWVVLSYGMGVDSTAILVRWLLDPSSRDFDLEDLIVITAHVGNEFSDTMRLVQGFVLPLLRKHGVRFVQVARTGASQAEINDQGRKGYTVLSDTREPWELHTAGNGYTLMDEMRDGGTVPQYRTGCRTCSQKFKGMPLDRWIADELQGANYRHVMGFNADEEKRMIKDTSYSKEQRTSEYPLKAWGWGRVEVEEYLEAWIGRPWTKSCCTFCPFANNKAGRAAHLERLTRHPAEAAAMCLMERSSTALNPRQTVYPGHSVEELLEAEGEPQSKALAIRDAELAAMEWAVYRVRRAWTDDTHAAREVRIMARGDERTMRARVAELATEHGQAVEDGRHARFWTSPKDVGNYPCAEQLFVAVPVIAHEKAIDKFAEKYAKAQAADKRRAAKAARAAAKAAKASA